MDTSNLEGNIHSSKLYVNKEQYEIELLSSIKLFNDCGVCDRYNDEYRNKKNELQ